MSLPRTLAVFAALFALAGCGTTSKVDPNADITITGTAAGVAAGTQVDLDPLATIGDFFGSAPPDHASTVDSRGAYTFEVKGSYTQTNFGNERPLVVRLPDPRDPAPGAVAGPETTATFVVRGTTVTLPELRLWEGVPDARLRDGDWVVQVPRLSSGATAGSAGVTLAGADGVLLAEGAGSGVVRVDARPLEDTSGLLWAHATAQRTPAEVTYRSATITAQGRLVPPSRGAECRFIQAGEHSKTSTTLCGFADGDLTTSSVPLAPHRCSEPDSSCRTPFAEIRLHDPVDAREIVVHGGSFRQIRVSADGRHFRTLSGISTAGGEVPAAGGISVSTWRGAIDRVVAVRVIAPDQNLAEISVWPAHSDPLPPTEVALDLPDRRGALMTPASSLPLLLIGAVLAGLLAGGALFGLSFRMGRTSSRPAAQGPVGPLGG